MNEIFSHLLVTVIYFLIISLLRFKIDINLLWLWAGAFLGTFLLDIDHLIYWFYSQTEEEDSRQAKVLLKFKNYKGLYKLLVSSHCYHQHLIFHTAIFQVILLILGFFILTSSGSLLGSALILSLNLHLLKDEWQGYLKINKENVASWLFWQIESLSTGQYIKAYLISVSVIFLILSLFIR